MYMCIRESVRSCICVLGVSGYPGKCTVMYMCVMCVRGINTRMCVRGIKKKMYAHVYVC